MKKYMLAAGVVMFVVFYACLFGYVLGADESSIWPDISSDSDRYIFPDTCITESMNWEELTCKMQIPEGIKQEMSDKGLFETCFSYPLYYAKIKTSAFPYEGFLETRNSFNGINEFLARKNSGRIILEFYENIDFDKSPEIIADHSDKIRYIEYMIAQDEILSGLNKNDRIRLRSLANDNIQRRNGRYKGILCADPALLISARISYMEDRKFREYALENMELMNFIETGNLSCFIPEKDLKILTDIP